MKFFPNLLRVGLLLSMPFCKLFAQETTETSTDEMLHYYAEVNSGFSTSGQNPFWLRNNQYGIAPINASPFGGRVGIYADYEKPSKDNKYLKAKPFDYGYGFELVGNTGTDARVLLPEMYVKLRYKSFEFYTGRRREIIGLVDSTLSSGSYAWSGTALPMPKIQIGLVNFTPLGFTKNFISVRGFFAHGWLEPTRSDVRGAFLHQKALYIRFGKPSAATKFIIGINHHAQWAGDNVYKNESYASDLAAYWNVITAKNLAGDSANIKKYGANEGENRLGNHLGTIDLGLSLDYDSFSLLFYRQHFLEDGSLLAGMNLEDGLNGISFTNKEKQKFGQKFYLKKALFEFLNTKSQGGGVYYGNPSRGRDNYFNHGIYTDGWSYYGRSVGTPFITPQAETVTDLPRYHSNTIQFFTNNNRVMAFHFALSGTVQEDWLWESRFSFSQNFGTYDLPFANTVNQFSGFFKLTKPLNWWDGASLTTTIAFDAGSLFKNSVGFQIGIRSTVWE